MLPRTEWYRIVGVVARREKRRPRTRLFRAKVLLLVAVRRRAPMNQESRRNVLAQLRRNEVETVTYRYRAPDRDLIEALRANQDRGKDPCRLKEIDISGYDQLNRRERRTIRRTRFVPALLERALADHPTLTSIRLSGNGIDCDILRTVFAAGAFFAAGGRFPALKELSLGNNEIRGPGTWSLCDALLSSSSRGAAVTGLDLSRNPIGNEGCEAVASSLRSSNCALQELDASCCRIEKDGYIALFRALTEGKTPLAELILGNNGDMDDETVSFVVALLDEQNCPLRRLEISRISNQSFWAVADALSNNTWLTHLAFGGTIEYHLSGAEFDERLVRDEDWLEIRDCVLRELVDLFCARALEKVVRRNGTLEACDVCRCDFADRRASFRRIVPALRTSNYALQTLDLFLGHDDDQYILDDILRRNEQVAKYFKRLNNLRKAMGSSSNSTGQGSYRGHNEDQADGGDSSDSETTDSDGDGEETDFPRALRATCLARCSEKPDFLYGILKSNLNDIAV